jgi:dynein heavy chain, axonemal
MFLTLTLCVCVSYMPNLSLSLSSFLQLQPYISTHHQASPATVSRCGMIYMEPQDIGWRPLVDSWLQRFVVKCDVQTMLASVKKDPRVVSGEISELEAMKTYEGRNFVMDQRSQAKILFLTEWLVDPCLAFLRKHMIEQSPTEDHFLVQSLLRTMEGIFENLLVGANVVESMDEVKSSKGRGRKRSGRKAGNDDDDDDDVRKQLRDGHIESVFVFSLIWTIGASTDSHGRLKFDEFLRKLFESSSFISEELPSVHRGLIVRGWKCPEQCQSGKFKFETPIPTSSGDSVYDFKFKCSRGTSSKHAGTWIKWDDDLPTLNLEGDVPFGSITVPTKITASLNYFLKNNIAHNMPTLICGPTGTGKSVCVQNVLNNQLDRHKFDSIKMGFSAKTTCNMAQNIVDGKLEKIRKGVYGPVPGKRMVLFVDDFNMPEREIYGAQPPLELMRQLIGSSGWYV